MEACRWVPELKHPQVSGEGEPGGAALQHPEQIASLQPSPLCASGGLRHLGYRQGEAEDVGEGRAAPWRCGGRALLEGAALMVDIVGWVSF